MQIYIAIAVSHRNEKFFRENILLSVDVIIAIALTIHISALEIIAAIMGREPSPSS